MKCVNCRRRKMSRPRGLCFACSLSAQIRSLYPVSDSVYAKRGVGCGCFTGAMPTPTTAAPGAPEKVEVLARRAANRQQLWHAGDARG
jgi:hypothetical protein